MSGLPVYVAAPYERANAVRHFHTELRAIGCMPTSHWATLAKGPEHLDTMNRAEVRSLIEVNDACMRRAVVLVVLARRGRGGETFAEASRALEWGIPLLWCGELILSAFRPGVWLCETPAAVLRALEHVATSTAVAVGTGSVHLLLGEHFGGHPAAATRLGAAG